jgi:hypothetical protein
MSSPGPKDEIAAAYHLSPLCSRMPTRCRAGPTGLQYDVVQRSNRIRLTRFREDKESRRESRGRANFCHASVRVCASLRGIVGVRCRLIYEATSPKRQGAAQPSDCPDALLMLPEKKQNPAARDGGGVNMPTCHQPFDVLGFYRDQHQWETVLDPSIIQSPSFKWFAPS